MTTTPTPAGAPDESADQAAGLDALLVDAALGRLRWLTPDGSTAKLAARLASHPRSTGQRLGSLAAEMIRIAAGRSTVVPSKRDRRFADSAWSANPLLRRVLQAYLATGQTAEQLVSDAELGWRDEQRVRFLVENLVEALAPSNVPVLNPASAKAAVDTAGLNFARGGLALAGDLAVPPRVPQMVDTSSFEVGHTVAVTPGAVVLRTEMLELIQYRPQTEQVREVPVLIVPPTINKYYALDLAPERSLVEYLVRNGQQVFVISWRNPDGRHAEWGLDAYVGAVLDGLAAVERVCGTDRTALLGVCAGGIIASITAAYLAGTGARDRLAAFGLLVTVLDNARSGRVGALVDERTAAAAIASSRRRGYLDGRSLAEVFAWLRPGDLVWNYWVNNYLLGKKPPAFDILFWNSDTTRMPAKLHADFVQLAMRNQLVTPGALTVLGVPVDLSKVDMDSYVVAGMGDHITPWQNCYRSVGLLGGDSRFVLASAGHIAALVNPPGNPKASYRVNDDNLADPAQWLQTADSVAGSWWPDFLTWLGERCGADKAAPAELGGGGLRPLSDAPGTYVFDR
jgi:poly[(R)-3-hydroxyalkanoate] polymerase subunit PhaC